MSVIRNARLEAGLTLHAAARMAGLDPVRFGEIERGAKFGPTPSDDELAAIERAVHPVACIFPDVYEGETSVRVYAHGGKLRIDLVSNQLGVMHRVDLDPCGIAVDIENGDPLSYEARPWVRGGDPE